MFRSPTGDIKTKMLCILKHSAQHSQGNMESLTNEDADQLANQATPQV